MKTSFAAWMALVNRAIENKCGLSADDLPDCDYFSWWQDGKAPAAAASKAVKLAGGDF